MFDKGGEALAVLGELTHFSLLQWVSSTAGLGDTGLCKTLGVDDVFGDLTMKFCSLSANHREAALLKNSHGCGVPSVYRSQ